MTAEYDKRKVAEQPQFYGRRRGRKLRPSQELALHQGMEEYALPSAELKASSLDPQQWFPKNCKQMCLEIGFGGGEHLAARASQNPDHGYIGAEPFVNGVASLCRHIKEQHLENIRIWNDDVRLLLPHLASSSLDAVYILFPDPWPKSRHAARRILQPEMLEMLSDKMRVGAELLLASDDPTAKSWLLATACRDDRFTWLANSPSDWRQPPADWPGTRYMRKAEIAGRTSVWFRFCRR